jgi:hypothetical protein
MMAFFVNVLKKHSSVSSSARTESGDVTGTKNSAAIPPAVSQTIKYNALGDISYDPVSSELLLALRIINGIILAEGDCSVPRKTILR